MGKQAKWQRMKQEWPDLAKFLTELKQAGMQAQRVDVDLWPTDSTDPHENLKQMREKLR